MMILVCKELDFRCNMSILETMKKRFDERHDFDKKEIAILQERWPSVDFMNIPTAWIFPIDELMGRMRYNNPFKKIRQEFGQLVVEHGELNEKQQKILVALEKKLYKIDEDLREGL